MQRLEEGIGELCVPTEPAFGLGVAQVEVQPEKAAAVACIADRLRLGQIRRGPSRIEWAHRLGRLGVEQVAADQPGFVTAIGSRDPTIQHTRRTGPE